MSQPHPQKSSREISVLISMTKFKMHYNLEDYDEEDLSS